MNVIALPKGFTHFSLSVSTAIALCAWTLYELSPVSAICASWPALQLFVITSRVVLIIALMIASFGIGAGSLLLGKVYWQLSRTLVPGKPWSRRALNGSRAATAATICLASLVIGTTCIGAWNLYAELVLFSGLQVSLLLGWKRYLRWRYFRTRISL